MGRFGCSVRFFVKISEMRVDGTLLCCSVDNMMYLDDLGYFVWISNVSVSRKTNWKLLNELFHYNLLGKQINDQTNGSGSHFPCSDSVNVVLTLVWTQ